MRKRLVLSQKLALVEVRNEENNNAWKERRDIRKTYKEVEITSNYLGSSFYKKIYPSVPLTSKEIKDLLKKA